LNENIIKISRKELYEQVWTEPVTQLSRRYGFSDVWLAKICRKYDIPRPPRGYWARIQSGQNVPKTPLPKRKDDPIINIHIRPSDTKVKNVLNKEVIQQRRSISEIVVPELLKEPHPLIAISSTILSSIKSDSAGILIPPDDHCLDIRVSRESHPRALRIMDALIKSLGTMNFEVSISRKATRINVFDVLLNISMGEKLYRRRLKAKDHNLDGYYQFGYNLYEDQPIPAGKLFLSIGDLGFYSSGEYRKNWRDTDSHRLEDSLKSFIAGLMKAAALKKAKNCAKDEQE
jgi:hypothetical protein